MRSRFLSATLALVLAGGLTTRAAAQCPDGSPPPCGSRSANAARRVNPPLDDRTWIVVPFDNLARTAEVDWMRGASVNLLYLDMSRWKDIRVIDDERVADLVRETPAAATAQQLSLNAGLAVARRAGAGRLVMGDVVKLGSRTTVTAKVFDVKTGQRVRSVREDAPVQDSVMPLFGKLAQKILDVAPPPGANVGALGTTRTDAYQEYIAGVTALNTFSLREARRRFAQALTFDSTFALAHFKMATVIGWDDPGNPQQREHAERAARYSAGLPPRIRALISGMAHQSAGEWSRACDEYSSVVKADSSDVEGWYGLGDCLYHDTGVVPVEGDSSRRQFRASWSNSVRAFHRVLELDPQYHLAYQHIVDAFTTLRRNAPCVPATATCVPYTAFVFRSGDTLITTPVPSTDAARVRQQSEAHTASRSKRRNLAAAEDIAREWVRVAPAQSRAGSALAIVLATAGKLDEAQHYLDVSASSGSLVEDMRRTLVRMEVAYKLGRGREAARLYDSVRAAGGPLPGGSTRMRFGNAISVYGLPFGRLTEYDSLLTASIPATAPPLVLQYTRQVVRAALGVPLNDSLALLEREVFTATSVRGAAAATRTIAQSLTSGLRLTRSSWPALDTTVRDLKLQPALALARGDTAALRRAARSIDSVVADIVAAVASDTGYTLVAAEAYLALGDTTAALTSLRFGLDSAMTTTSFFPQQISGPTAANFVPRLMLLRADLAAARGFRDESRVWYQRFLDAWSGAAPELQPLVERGRRSYAATGGR